MKKTVFLIFISLFFTSNCFSQKKENITEKSETYVSLKFYKLIYKKKLTKKDSVNFKIRGKDTLILVKDKSKITEYISNSNKINKRELERIEEFKAYISLSQYKKKYKREITKEDIANFLFKDGDTLIQVNNKDFYKKGVSVPYQPKDSAFLEIYKDVVYQKYNTSLDKNKRKDYMRLWRIPIKIYFAKSLDIEYKNAIIKTANMLSKEVDSLNISFVDKLENSNYIIYQVDDVHKYKYSALLSKNTYIDYSISWNNNKIYDGKLEVNLTKYKNLSRYTNISYINQVFFKSLGRFYETKKMSNRGILSKIGINSKSILKLDLEILKYHYSFGICKGTDLEIFEEQHKKAKEIFKKTGRHLQFKHID